MFDGLPKQLSSHLSCSFHSLFKITTTKPRLGAVLAMNAVLFICQLFGKFQPLVLMFNGLFKQLGCIAFNSHGLFKITTAKPESGIHLFFKAVLFIY